jgi:hypothetical protein
VESLSLESLSLVSLSLESLSLKSHSLKSHNLEQIGDLISGMPLTKTRPRRKFRANSVKCRWLYIQTEAVPKKDTRNTLI